MSIHSPRISAESYADHIMKVIRFALFTSLVTLQPAESRAPEFIQEPEKNYDYLFKDVEIIPSDPPKKQPMKKGEDDNESDHSDFIDDPFCTPETCKYG